MKHEEPRILIIDDDVDLLMLMERRLGKEGFWAESAASLPEARELIPSWQPDLLLLDINVAGEDGRQLCYELKKDPRFCHLPIILISGYDPSFRRGTLFGADAVLPKPLKTDELLRTMRYFVNGEGSMVNSE